MSSSTKKSKKKSSSSRHPYETTEERKARKEKKKAEKLTQSFGYSNDSNPFGDSNLTERFIWKKKTTTSVGSDEKNRRVKRRDSSSKTKDREDKREELVDEIRKARQRRINREDQLEEMERLKQEEMRLKDVAEYHNWSQKEDAFHLYQATLRARMCHVALTEVESTSAGTTTLDGKEQQRSIKKSPQHPLVDEWITCYVLFSPHRFILNQCYQKSTIEQEFETKLNQNLLSCGAFCCPLTSPLVQLQDQLQDHESIRLVMDQIQEFIDLMHHGLGVESVGVAGAGAEKQAVISFWNQILVVCAHDLSRIERSGGGGGTSHSKRQIQDDISKMLSDKSNSELLDLQQDIIQTLEQAAAGTDGIDGEYWEQVLTFVHLALAKDEIHQNIQQMEKCAADCLTPMVTPNPVLDSQPNESRGSSIDQSAEAIAMERHFATSSMSSSAAEGDEQEMEENTNEVQLRPQTFEWSSQYRPRKPRYFNRVKTGFDWNKYNQTHYDHENPPPKVVQGYKFNIFYPDLIEKHVTPKFFIERMSDNNPHFCIIRFHAGPPYEDVAFQIVNREWEHGQKRGFKSVFERGILHLYFNFKRHRYRR